MTAIREVRWGLVVGAALLTELSVIAIFFLLLLGVDYADALVSSFVMVFLFRLWVGTRIESGFVLHGVLVGVVATLHPRRVGVLCCAIVMSATHVACAGDLPLPQPGGEAPRPLVGEAPRSPVLMPSQEESVDALFMKVQSLVGMIPVECGRHYLGRAGTSELEQSLKCGMDAARAKRPFWTFNQLQGMDSWIAEGLVGGPDGAIRSFAYDSSPSGNPADTSRARLTVSPCARPSVVSIAINGSARFSCADRRP